MSAACFAYVRIHNSEDGFASHILMPEAKNLSHFDLQTNRTRPCETDPTTLYTVTSRALRLMISTNASDTAATAARIYDENLV